MVCKTDQSKGQEMTPHIYKVKVTTEIVVSAMSTDEAVAAVKRHCFVDGATQKFSNPVRITDVSELPKGWTGVELAFSLQEYPPYGQRSIGKWLEKRGEK